MSADDRIDPECMEPREPTLVERLLASGPTPSLITVRQAAARLAAVEAENAALRQDAQRWRYWRRHFRALTTMTVAREVGIDLSRVHVQSAEDIDAVTDAARAKEGS